MKYTAAAAQTSNPKPKILQGSQFAPHLEPPKFCHSRIGICTQIHEPSGLGTGCPYFGSGSGFGLLQGRVVVICCRKSLMRKILHFPRQIQHDSILLCPAEAIPPARSPVQVLFCCSSWKGAPEPCTAPVINSTNLTRDLKRFAIKLRVSREVGRGPNNASTFNLISPSGAICQKIKPETSQASTLAVRQSRPSVSRQIVSRRAPGIPQDLAEADGP